MKANHWKSDPRLLAVQVLISEGHIEKFIDVLPHITKNALANILSTNNTRITRLIYHPMDFTLKELTKIGDAIGVDIETMIVLVLNQAQSNAKKENKNEVNK